MTFKKCSTCGQMVEMLKETDIPIICCGKAMDTLVPDNGDGAYEKHVPFLVKDDEKHFTVRIGEILHPALEAHHIEWILIETNLRIVRFNLSPTEEPTRKFEISRKSNEKILNIYENCNLHGLYMKNVE